MSDKSKKLNKDFGKKTLETARKFAEKYEVIIIFEDGEYYGKGLEMPMVFGDGKTPNQCVKNLRDALTYAVAHLIETGKPVPAPASEGKRTEQVNVRLTVEEKLILASSAKSHGYRGLADYIRAKVLAG